VSPFLTSTGMTSPVFAATAGADGKNFTLLGLFFGGVGDDQTAGGRCFALSGKDHDAVFEGLKVHSWSLRRQLVVALAGCERLALSAWDC